MGQGLGRGGKGSIHMEGMIAYPFSIISSPSRDWMNKKSGFIGCCDLREFVLVVVVGG